MLNFNNLKTQVTTMTDTHQRSTKASDSKAAVKQWMKADIPHPKFSRLICIASSLTYEDIYDLQGYCLMLTYMFHSFLVD